MSTHTHKLTALTQPAGPEGRGGFVLLESKDIRDGEVQYLPYVGANGEVGYQCRHDDGRRVEYIYFNPSSSEGPGDWNVFVYQGTEGDPANDGPLHFYMVFDPATDGLKTRAGDERCITLFADESREEQAARLHALKADPNTLYFARDDHDRPDLPAWPLPADVWVWSSGGTWVATVARFHEDDWWEGSDPEDWDDAPHRWYRPISDVPTIGSLSYCTREGGPCDGPAR